MDEIIMSTKVVPLRIHYEIHVQQYNQSSNFYKPITKMKSVYIVIDFHIYRIFI